VLAWQLRGLGVCGAGIGHFFFFFLFFSLSRANRAEKKVMKMK
jgi:hypothetical protein